ncbi:MAG: hypothetical protein AABZ85_05030, partial [Thermodesulfobacteriota bacterium]
MDLVDLSELKEGEGERTVGHSVKSLTPISTHNTLRRVEGYFQDIQHRSGGKLGFYRAEISTVLTGGWFDTEIFERKDDRHLEPGKP